MAFLGTLNMAGDEPISQNRGFVMDIPTLQELKEDNELNNVVQIVPPEELAQIRRLSDLERHLPAKVAGLTVLWDSSTRGENAAGNGGSFLVSTNAPAHTQLGRHFKPADVAQLLAKLPREYDHELREWEGDLTGVPDQGRGGRNTFHLLEQALIMGPDGDPDYKRGPAPIPWDLAYAATDRLIERIRQGIGKKYILPKALISSTPSSYWRTLRMSHVMDKSAGAPYFERARGKPTSKGANHQEIFDTASSFLDPVSKLPMWPFMAFARGDRGFDYEGYVTDIKAKGDLDEARTKSRAYWNLRKKDRLIAGQSANLQMLDGLFTQALMEEIQGSDLYEIDVRDPFALANWFVEGRSRMGPADYSIGTDESGWDHHMTPQMAYLCYCVYEALFPEETDVLVGLDQTTPIQADISLLDQLDSLAPGGTRTAQVTAVRAGEERFEYRRFTKKTIRVPDVLRRVWAGAFGTDARFGNVVVTGYKHILETPRHGKFQCGWSQRSGNLSTFANNSFANVIKQYVKDIASHRADGQAWYRDNYGVDPPTMKLKWVVVRGDDAASVWTVDRNSDIPISQLWTNWALMMGGKANAKKQDTSDERGRWRFGFAQLFTNENYPRGVSSIIRVVERSMWDEQDEVITVDPLDGMDLRPYLEVSALYGRVNNLWGPFGRERHPMAESITALIQDLDKENRFRPPLDEKGREASARAFALRMLRRGQIRPEEVGDVAAAYWGTDLSKYVESRLERGGKLMTDWTPIPWYEDARKEWRI